MESATDQRGTQRPTRGSTRRRAAETRFTPDDRAVVAEYLSFTRGADGGCVELDVLKHWRVKGIVGHKIGA